MFKVFLAKLVLLSETERIELLMIMGYGDKRGSFTQVVTLFSEIHPDEKPFLSRRFRKPYEDLMKLEVLKNVQNLPGEKLLQIPLMSS